LLENSLLASPPALHTAGCLPGHAWESTSERKKVTEKRWDVREKQSNQRRKEKILVSCTRENMCEVR